LIDKKWINKKNGTIKVCNQIKGNCMASLLGTSFSNKNNGPSVDNREVMIKAINDKAPKIFQTSASLIGHSLLLKHR
jgi:hypothetical protein